MRFWRQYEENRAIKPCSRPGARRAISSLVIAKDVTQPDLPEYISNTALCGFVSSLPHWVYCWLFSHCTWYVVVANKVLSLSLSLSLSVSLSSLSLSLSSILMCVCRWMDGCGVCWLRYMTSLLTLTTTCHSLTRVYTASQLDSATGLSCSTLYKYRIYVIVSVCV